MSRHRQEDNIGMDLKEIGVNISNWIDSTQDRNYCRALVNVSLNLQVQQTMDLVNFLVIIIIEEIYS